MRCAFAVVLAVLVTFSTSAFAGDVTVMNGQVTWKTTQCALPATPLSLINADRHMPANDMNLLVTQYNEYTKLMRVYMDCMSSEAQNDATQTSQAIINSAQGMIDATQKSVDQLGAPLRK